jgi:cell division protein ZapA (FtsZ GTPase activity inhibitor)
VECTSKDPQSVGKVVMDAVNIVLDADKLRKKSNEKQYKQELKKDEKDAKKLAKLQSKQQQRSSVSLPGTVDKGKQPEIASS